MSQPTPTERRIIYRAGRMVHRLWPREEQAPLFIVGCPRSGTTILGEIISQHPDCFYLFEPRPIWVQVEPRLNIWGENAQGGQLVWEAAHYQANHALRLRRWFHFARSLGRKPRLVEKLPLNVFRLPWMAQVFPNARFIHIIRHGRDAALSLAKLVSRRFPPGYWETHWNYLMFEQYAARHADLRPALQGAQNAPDNYGRALLVWACAVHAGLRARSRLGERLLEIHYEDLVTRPRPTLEKLLAFAELSPAPRVIAHAQNTLHPHSLHKPDPAPALTQAIAGGFLKQNGYDD